MSEIKDLTFSRLEQCSYRTLQQAAKALALPCNVKKVYLIEMIRAKKCSDTKALEAVIEQIRVQRQQQALKRARGKKKRLQGTDITSTNSQSAPITLTPKRPRYIVTNPNPAKHQRFNILRPTISKGNAESDRVLRSFNMRMRNYRVLNVNTHSIFGMIRRQSPVCGTPDIEKTYQRELLLRTYPSRARAIQHRLHSIRHLDDGERESAASNDSSPPCPARRNRQLSGIYPLNPPALRYRCSPVGCWTQNSPIAKIKGLVYKPNENIIENRALVRRIPLTDVLPEPSSDLDRNSSTESVSSNMETILSENTTDVINFVDVSNVEIQTESGKLQKKSDKVKATYYKENGNQQTEVVIRADRETNRSMCDGEKRALMSVNCLENSKTVNDRRKNSNLTELNKQAETEDTRRLPINYARKQNVTQQTNQHGPLDYRSIGSQNKYIENQRYALNKYSENPNYPSNKYTENGNSAPNRYTENPNYPLHEYTENQYCANRNSEGQNYAPNKYAENPNYPPNKYIENQDHVSNSRVDNESDCVYDDVRVRNENYPNMSALTDVYPDNRYSYTELSSNHRGSFSMYYHKKIRSEQVRSNRNSTRQEERNVCEKLPKISEVFSQFNDKQYKLVAQPMLLEDRHPPEREQYIPIEDPQMLEAIYNIKSLCPPHPTDTRCVFSTPVISTPVALNTPAIDNRFETFVQPNYNMESENTAMSYDYMKRAQQERENVMRDQDPVRPTVSRESVHMVDDAMEVISQDGDYMDRVDADVRMSCIFCSVWAGPKNMLEYHVRKDHWKLINPVGGEWCVTVPLGSVWSASAYRMSQLSDELYVLAAACVRPHSLSLALCSFPTLAEEIQPKYCRLTIYQKTSNNPIIWEGEVTPVCENNNNGIGLEIDINSLKILPSNVIWVGSKRVFEYNGKEITMDDLTGVEVMVFVKVFD